VPRAIAVTTAKLIFRNMRCNPSVDADGRLLILPRSSLAAAAQFS
jgi:hypothetical protein